MIYSDGTIITASLSDYGPGFLPMGFPYRRHPFVYYIEALSEMEAPKGDGITAVKKRRRAAANVSFHLYYITSMQRWQAVDVIVVIIDFKRCFRIPAQLDKRPCLEHG